MNENIIFSKILLDYRNSENDFLKIQYIIDNVTMNFIFDSFAIEKLGLSGVDDKEIIEKTSAIISEQIDSIKQMHKPNFDIKMVVNKVENVYLTDVRAHNFTHSNTNDFIRGVSKSNKNGKPGRYYLKKDGLKMLNDGKIVFSSTDKTNRKRTFISSDKLPIILDEDVSKKLNIRIMFD